jgi:uncharacterized protein YdeI (YjbR/CyaY-like superfamily)
MIKVESVEEFIALHPSRKSELELLRKIALSVGLDEAIKWNSPVYTYKGKNVAGLGAFKSYVGIWFYQGVFLNDKNGVLLNAQEGVTKGLRQWRFNSAKEIDDGLVRRYLIEALENEKLGKRILPEKKSLQVPAELADAFKKNENLLLAFEQFTNYKKKEFAEYVGGAKKEATRLRRLAKCIELIIQGTGLNDKYL